MKIAAGVQGNSKERQYETRFEKHRNLLSPLGRREEAEQNTFAISFSLVVSEQKKKTDKEVYRRRGHRLQKEKKKTVISYW